MVSVTSRGFLLGVLLLVFRGTFGLDTGTVSIASESDYAIEPACVQSCVFKTYISSIASFLLSDLGCQSTPFYNACYCTQIADQKASTILSSCVNSLCTGTSEISNAISLYQSYCVGAGYPRSVAATPTTSASSSGTSISSSQLEPSTPTPTPASASTTTTPTSTSSPSANTPSASPYSTSPPLAADPSSPTSTPTTSTNSKPNIVPIIGGAIGGVAVLLILSTLLYLLLRKNRSSSSSKPEESTSVSMQSLVRTKVELENNGVKPAENAIIVPTKPLAEISHERGYTMDQRELRGGGRYVGELYGGGGHVRGVELSGNEGWKV